jgi:hypothetical protein
VTTTGPEEPQRQDKARPAADDASEIVKQLRSAPAEEIVAEAFLMLLNAAQIKLGRRDARLLIDLSTVMLEHTGDYLPDTLVKQVEQSLGQLRLGQVSAENELAKRGQPEPNDLTQAPTPPSTSSGGRPSAAASQSPTSGLWVPGR